MRRAPFLALVAVLAACGSGHAAHTVVQHYGVFPSDTIAVSTTNPTSSDCRSDAGALARAGLGFVRAHHTTVNIGDVAFFEMRESSADFEARRCEPKLLGDALVHTLSPGQRRELLGDTSRPMAKLLRSALSAAGA